MFATSRRNLLATSMAGVSAILNAATTCASATSPKDARRLPGRPNTKLPKGLLEAARFPLIEAIHGRRSRRFALGATIPDGPLAYSSKHQPEPLSELEQLLLLTTVAGNTGWSNLIPYNRFYLPNLPNYAASAGGRSFPSAAGFHTSDVFFTDDDGVYFMSTRDMPATHASVDDGPTDLAAYFAEHSARIVKLADGRLEIPPSPNHMEIHNDWCANVPGSTLVIPIADLAQHQILNLCYLVQNGACLYDDVNGRPIPGLEKFKTIVDIENPFPLTYVDQIGLTEVTVETSNACYAGTLMLQAMGLGGWMYGGLNPFSVLGASGDPQVPGLGFRYDVDERWPLPNVTGRDGIFEGHCPPHFADMASAVEAVVRRKFGEGGPFNAQTGGPYKRNSEIRSRAVPHDEAFKDCVTLMANYVHETFGRFPATVPSIFVMMYLQAHKLDTEFYDTHFAPGAYLRTHAEHSKNWRS